MASAATILARVAPEYEPMLNGIPHASADARSELEPFVRQQKDPAEARS